MCVCVLGENSEADLLKSINHANTATNVMEVCCGRPVSSDHYAQWNRLLALLIGY